MTSEPRDNTYGRTMSEWISLIPGELPRDAVSFRQILSGGELYFELTGAALVDFIRRAISGLLDAGAVPVKGGKGTGYEWVIKSNYGSGRDEIIDSIISEWQANKEDEMYPWGLWFARPLPGKKYVKL